MKKTQLKKIIKEEVSKVLNEDHRYTTDRYTTEVDIDMDKDSMYKYNILIQGNDEFGVVLGKNVSIKWYADYEYRDWGIKGIYPAIPDQKITIPYEVDSEDGYDPFDTEIEIKDVNIVIDQPTSELFSIALRPILIEFYKNKITVHFDIY